MSSKDSDQILEVHNELTRCVIGCAVEVHRNLGPGLLESVYEGCLAYELSSSGLDYRRQVTLPVKYKGECLELGYRVDLLVEERLVVELKAVEAVSSLHQAQILTYMRLAQVRLGLIINFHNTILKNSIKRFIL
jgi:GxxExxY protein